jgi:general secretion pathway protein A
MYVDYFKLNEPPFSLTPDPRYLFMSERHREGLAHLLYGVQQPGGFVQLTGEIGSGKTTLCRCLIKQLPADTDVALILNPRLTVVELLATVCDELRIPYPADTGSIKILIDALNQRLLDTHAQRRHTVLIIDEAQNLHSEVLEQIRLLTNLETSREKLLQIILIGQPELLTLLKGEKLRQLAQRITARYHLSPLSRRETCAYIQHRLRVAGRRDPLFTERAMRRVFRLSRGMPRIINIICDRALLGAYALDKRRVGAAIVGRANREARGLVPSYRRPRLAKTAGIAALAALLVGGAIWLGPTDHSVFHRSPAAVTPIVRVRSDDAERPTVATPKLDRILIKGDDLAKPAVETTKTLEAVRQPNSGAGSRLVDILANPSLGNSGGLSFATIFALWGAKIPVYPSDLGCKVATAHGFECLFQTGSWLKLRRFDLPVILEMVLPNGTHCRAALVRVGDEAATLALGDRQYTLPLGEIDRGWDGSFILLWKPPFAARQIAYGARGAEVLWIRQALDHLAGKTPNPAASDLYDEDLRRRVMEFQRERSLTPNGVVGSETLVRITLALEGPKAPSLSGHAR